MRTLLDGDEHDVRDSHDAAKQGEDADDPKAQFQQVHGCHDLLVLSEAIADVNSTLVVRVEAMDASQGFPVILLEGIRPLLCVQSFRGSHDDIQLIAFIVYQLQSGERNDGRTALVVPLIIVDAHHLINHIVRLDKLAQWLCLPEENLGSLLVQHYGFSPFSDI